MLTQTQPVGDQHEADEAKEHHVELFEAREDAAIAFEAAEEPFDLIAALVHLTVVFPGLDAAAPAPQQQHGWIVDTCIECDHQRFSGFLKVSIEEVLIALRDDRHLLNDPEGLLSGTYDPDRFAEDETRHSSWTLYPEGFRVERFIEVIETEAVWEERAAGPTA